MPSLPLQLLAVLLSQCGLLSGYGSGGPSSQCGSMTPGHGLAPKSSSPPFQVQLSSNKIPPGASINVELKPKGSEEFEGFFVQARDSLDNVVGAFEILGDDGKYVTCDNKPQSTVTHANANFKKSFKVKWNAPSDFQGKIQFLSTFVTDYSTYWVKVPSSDLEVVKDTTQGGFIFPSSETSSTEPEPEAEPDAEPEPEAEAEPKSEPEAESEAEPEPNHGSSDKKSDLYLDCGSSKSCLGFPGGCLGDYSCQLFASWRSLGDSGYELELFTQSGRGRYAALGLSEDSSMGGDLVIACGSATKAELFWNSGKSAPSLLSSVSGIKDYKVTNSDGSKLCRIQTEQKIGAGDKMKNLDNDHHLLLAGGPYTAGALGYHVTTKVATESPLALSRVSSIGIGRGDLLYRLHGALMLVAWLGCAGAGMILARYFKRTWKGKQFMGKDLWFVLHRSLMTLTVLLSIAAVILVVVEAKLDPLALSSLRINAHPVIGLLCIILAILQPVMAALRPHPGADKRPLFNWAHWMVGNSAYILGLVAMFLASSLAKANLSTVSWWTWILMTFVILHFIVHVILSIDMARSERSGEVGDTDTGHKMTMEEEGRTGERSSSLRIIIVVFYMLAAWAVAIAMITAVLKA